MRLRLCIYPARPGEQDRTIAIGGDVASKGGEIISHDIVTDDDTDPPIKLHVFIIEMKDEKAVSWVHYLQFLGYVQSWDEVKEGDDNADSQPEAKGSDSASARKGKGGPRKNPGA